MADSQSCSKRESLGHWCFPQLTTLCELLAATYPHFEHYPSALLGNGCWIPQLWQVLEAQHSQTKNRRHLGACVSGAWPSQSLATTVLSNAPPLWTFQPHSSLRIWAFIPRPRPLKHISPVFMVRYIFSGRVLCRHKLTQVRNAKVNLKDRESYKGAHCMRGPGHQVLQEAPLSLSTLTFHSFLPWLPYAALTAECKRKK